MDSAYLAKVYVNEADSVSVRRALNRASVRISSVWVIAEVTCVFHRHVREGALTPSESHVLLERFLRHADEGVWKLVPVTESLLRRCSILVSGLPAAVFLRAGDALHLTTAVDCGEREIWTNDRHLLAAAPHFGLTGRTV